MEFFSPGELALMVAGARRWAKAASTLAHASGVLGLLKGSQSLGVALARLCAVVVFRLEDKNYSGSVGPDVGRLP